MDDLISRQAAIDAVYKCTDIFINNLPVMVDKADAYKELANLPSAQPERNHEQPQRKFLELLVEYIDPKLCTYKECRGKPYFSIKFIENGETIVGYGTYKPEVLSSYIRDYFMPSAQPEQHWIPVTERLPEHDGEAYLVSDYCEQINRKRIHISYCYMNREGFWSDVPLGYKVLAWMPLPEPWRGEI